MGDIKQWSSRHRRFRDRYRRRHRRSRSNVERCKKAIVGKHELNRMLRRGGGVLPFVRRRSSFVCRHGRRR
ncbi:hypothetical protein [Absidia glauca]|uniref:Uncharacterized protein n=1 Tax=Absidia glauca TaxID=4829 RepID=A0A163JQC3_ABSGL|nr:hypothetical protein [Absidia glauca]